MYHLFSENYNEKQPKKLPILWILKVPRTLRFLVVLRIQPHFHPMPKGEGLSRSERAVRQRGDGIYGFFENLKKHAGAMTLEAYMRFNAKLSQAKDEMGAKEYEEFTKELKKLTNAKLEYGDSI